jgi:hypothetical protein
MLVSVNYNAQRICCHKGSAARNCIRDSKRPRQMMLRAADRKNEVRATDEPEHPPFGEVTATIFSSSTLWLRPL